LHYPKKYYLDCIELNPEWDFIKEILLYRTIDQYLDDTKFGNIVIKDEAEIIYEVEMGYEYVTFSFIHEKLDKITFVFRAH
jgi:hypothetical protein